MNEYQLAGCRVRLRSFREISVNQAEEAMEEAFKIIEKVGTTGIEHQHDQAREWLRKYYPEYAD